MRKGADEIVGPDVIGSLGPRPYTRSVIEPQPSRERWHSWILRHCIFCNLQNGKTRGKNDPVSGHHHHYTLLHASVHSDHRIDAPAGGLILFAALHGQGGFEPLTSTVSNFG